MVENNNIIDNFKEIENIPVIKIKEARNALPFFTIAIPTYKRAELLKETLNSALLQKGNIDYNVLVVDNNPERDDSTEKLLSTYEDTRILYYKNSCNIGAVGNWNRLYALAQGRYVVMLHDDDLLFPNYIETLYHIINKTKAKYAAYFIPYIYGYNKNPTDILKVYDVISIRINTCKMFDFIKGNILGPPIGMCLKNGVIQKLGGFRDQFYPCIDYDFYVNLSRYEKICRLEGKPLAVYRIGKNDSAKKETMLSIVKADLKIKNNILQQRGIFRQKLWERYIKVYAYKHLESLKLLFQNDTFISEMELRNIGVFYNSIDIWVYKLINLYKWIMRKYKRIIIIFFTKKYRVKFVPKIS